MQDETKFLQALLYLLTFLISPIAFVNKNRCATTSMPLLSFRLYAGVLHQKRFEWWAIDLK